MKKSILYSLTIAFLLTAAFNQASAQRYGNFTELIGDNATYTEFFVPGGPHISAPYKVIIAFHPYDTPPEAIRNMILPSAEKYNAILACPNVHPNYSGAVSEDIIAYLNENYTLEDKNVVLTGYSAGGNAMFDYGLPNYAKIKGLIGIAPTPNIPQSNYQYLDKLPISIIVGTSDHLYSAAKEVQKAVEDRGGSFKMIEKSGVGHTGQYFWSPEFNQDWDECYDFIQSWLPKANPINLLEPENNLENIELQINFSWEESELADSYKIQISEEESFAAITEETELDGTSYSSKNLESGKTYYWRVCGINTSGDGSWSNTWTFSTMPEAPDAAVLVGPKNNTTDVEFPIELHWNSVESAEKYIVKLWDTENEDPIFEAELQEDGMESYIQVAPCDPGTEYEWQVETVNFAGSNASGRWSFITLQLLTEAPKPLYPESGAENIPAKTEFRWQAIEGADSYVLEIGRPHTSEPLFRFEDITSSSQLVKKEVELEEGTTYMWELFAANSAGEGPSSGSNIFTTEGVNSVIDIVSNEYDPYPNPFYNSVAIEFESENIGKAIIKISDNTGKSVHSQSIDILYGKNVFNWQANNLNSGLYYYCISLENNQCITGKLVYVQ